MNGTMIDRLYAEHQMLIDFLTRAGEASLVNNVDANFRKALLLSAASYFELRIRDCLIDFLSEKAGEDECVLAFFKSKAIERQYHTYFNWKDRQANQFFGLFGSGFRTFMIAEVKNDEALNNSIKAFLELGESRNLLVHQDYANYPLEKTVEEIYKLYQLSLVFIDTLPKKLRSYSEGKKANDASNVTE